METIANCAANCSWFIAFVFGMILINFVSLIAVYMFDMFWQKEPFGDDSFNVDVSQVFANNINQFTENVKNSLNGYAVSSSDVDFQV